MTEENFEMIKEELNNFLNITENNYIQKNFEYISFYQRYLEIYLHELKIFKDLSVTFADLKAKKHLFYKFNFNYKLSSLSEIETFVDGDSEILAITRKMNEQENALKFLESSLKSIKDVGYVVKNYLDYEKIRMGD